LDPITTALQLGFYVLFLASVVQYVRYRGPLQLSVLAIFGSFAALFALSFLNTLQPAIAPIARPVLIAILFAQPFLVLRLIAQIRPIRAVVQQAAFLGAVIAWECVTLVPPIAATLGEPAGPTLRTIGTLYAIAYFFAVEVGAAAWLARESRRRFGVARIRVASAAVATGLFGASILIAGLASVGRPPGATASVDAQTVTRFLAFIAAAGYLAAFVPPAWFRRIVNRAASYQLVRNLVAPATTATAGSLWTDLAVTAREILGARRVSILSAGPDGPLAVVGDSAPFSRSVGGRQPILSTVEFEIRPGDPMTERLVAEVEGRPLFVGDDVNLLVDLGSLTGHAIEREEMLIGLGEARREAEESRTIRASEARFRALLEADPNAILALDEESKVTWATRLAGELFGAPVDRLIGVPLSELVALPREESTTSTGERPVFRAETTGRRMDGTHFPAEMARSSFELDGRPFQVAVISDVSWRHEADQIRDRFLGVLSHELRTPVTSIYGGTQLLLGRGARLDPETRNELLVSVAAEAERLQRMIENLVAMARIERGGDFGGARPVLLERIINQLVEREKALWPEVTIRLASNGPVQMVAADEEYLAQIMRNLLSNAAKYSGSGSTVEVSLEDAEGEVLVRVRDDGPGITEEDADRLFGLYFRSATAAATAPGAGIGLFVCRELVATMGGRIWARPLPEKGAEFGFSIPAYVDELDALPADPEPAAVFDRDGHPTASAPA
jgi:PAS domain S-box-containing protein